MTSSFVGDEKSWCLKKSTHAIVLRKLVIPLNMTLETLVWSD